METDLLASIDRTYSHEPMVAASTTPASEVMKSFATDPISGLDPSIAAQRLAALGPNELRKPHQAGVFTVFLRQFQSSVVALLLAAAGISVGTGDFTQALAILAAIFINATVGFFTELRAKFSLEALEALAGPTARVRRGGQDLELPARELVPGDLLILGPGDRIAADVRFVEAASVSVDQSALSGESVPVFKSSEPVPGEDKPSTLAYQGTLVTQGRAVAVVVATGDKTRLGRLGKLLSESISTRTPLERKLEELGRQLTLATIVLCAILAAVGIWHRYEISTMLETSIALAVAAIPEGLPVVATLALAIGTQRMVRARALVRQLAAVETLGCTTVICADKTGTLTQNQLMVTDLILIGRCLKVSGRGYEPIGEMTEEGAPVCFVEDHILLDLLTAAALCNDARIENHSGEVPWHVHGDPTEGALLAAAAKAGLDDEKLRAQFERVREIPFDLSRKMMTTVHANPSGGLVAYVKGSPESIFSASTSVLTPSGVEPIDPAARQWFNTHNEELAARGLRVLAVATRSLPEDQVDLPSTEVERDLTLIGLVGMSDRPKPGVKEAVLDCHRAGLRVMMLTGDQPLTAKAIAKELHILTHEELDGAVITGAELEGSDDEHLRKILKNARVLARVTPEMKLAIVRALQDQGEIVAMTGDGVNDAPALRQADIGVAMGERGTALAREASNMVITDDNFGTIVKAVKQGRVIYTNIKRSIAYLLTASLAAVITVGAAVLTNAGLPLLPLQLLWLNLIMHIFPGLGIVLKPADPGIMSQAPRQSSEKLLGPTEQLQIFARAALVSLSVLAAITLNLKSGGGGPGITTVAFATLSLALLFQAWSWARPSTHERRREEGVLFGSAMLANMAIAYLLLAIAIYWAPLQSILSTQPLSCGDWLLVAGAATGSCAATWALQPLFRRLGLANHPGG